MRIPGDPFISPQTAKDPRLRNEPNFALLVRDLRGREFCHRMRFSWMESALPMSGVDISGASEMQQRGGMEMSPPILYPSGLHSGQETHGSCFIIKGSSATAQHIYGELGDKGKAEGKHADWLVIPEYDQMLIMWSPFPCHRTRALATVALRTHENCT